MLTEYVNGLISFYCDITNYHMFNSISGGYHSCNNFLIFYFDNVTIDFLRMTLDVLHYKSYK